MRKPWIIPSKLICITASFLMTGIACGETAEKSGTPVQEDTLEAHEGTPTLLDLGSRTCVPCQMMEEELARLEEMTGDRLTVTFIDVNQDQSAASRYGVRVIPTQIFLAPDGTELHRHEGYISVEQMLEQWTDLGYDLYEASESSDAP